MTQDTIKRDVLVGGDLRLSTAGCTFLFKRPRPAVLLVTISGEDQGQFGTMALDEIVTAIRREHPLELFVDAQDATGSVSVSEEWTRFFSSYRAELSRVHVLVGSKFMQLTVAIAQHLSRTGNLIQIYSDPQTFQSLLRSSP